jgi:hypothetical protein
MADTTEFFASILPAKLAANKDLAAEINAVYQFDITGAGTWTVDLTVEGGVVRDGPVEAAGCVVTAEKEDFETMLDNPDAAMMLFTMGKLMVTDIPLALSIQKLIS